MNNDTGIDTKPPYVAYKTFQNFVVGLRESGIPDRIDRSVMPGLSGAAQSNLLLALKFLGFVNGIGAPTATLRELVDNPKNEKATIGDAIRKGYGFIFNNDFNIQAATETQVLDKFREKELSGETVRKCLSFFILICNAAGIAISPHLKVKRSGSSGTGGGSGSRRNRRRRTADEGDVDVDEIDEPQQQPKSLQEMLLEKFPSFDPSWDKDMQAKWFASFEQFMKAAKESEK